MEEVKELINKKLAGQGNQTDISGALAKILLLLVERIAIMGSGSNIYPVNLTLSSNGTLSAQ